MSIIPINKLIIDKRIITSITNTIKKWDKNKKPLLLCGNSGIGKTTAILSIAHSLKYNVQNIDPDFDYTK